jgi:uncharacterized membrane protein
VATAKEQKMIDEPSAPADHEKLTAMLAYGLYLLAIVNGITLLIGFIVALVRRDSARGTLYESHYRNLVTVFFVVAAFGVVVLGAALTGLLSLLSLSFLPHFWWHFDGWFPFPALFVPGALLGWFLLGLWYLWRVIGGFIRAIEEKPY